MEQRTRFWSGFSWTNPKRRGVTKGLYTSNWMDGADIVFFDGDCGLCHRSVVFLLNRDHGGTLFRFAPLSSSLFLDVAKEMEGEVLNGTLVVLTARGAVLTRSAAVAHVLSRLHLPWRMAGKILEWVPVSIRDFFYRRVAEARQRFFRPPKAGCPLVSPEKKSRFLV